MLVCHGCHRHVRIEEDDCPFCGSALGRTPAPGISLTAVLVATLGLTTMACATRPVDESNDSGTTTMESMSSETAGMVTSIGDGDGDDWAEASAYAGPEEEADWETEETGPVGDGDGEPAGVPCQAFSIGSLELGDNPVVLIDTPSLIESSCSFEGPEVVHSFTAPADGLYTFEILDHDFNVNVDVALALAGEQCDPLEELACEVNALVPQDLLADQTIYLVVDVPPGVEGMANLQITQP